MRGERCFVNSRVQIHSLEKKKKHPTFHSLNIYIWSQAGFDKVTSVHPGVLTIYTENPEIPVGKSNGTHHSIWSTSEIMGFWSK